MYIRTWNYLPLLKQGQSSLLIQGHLSYLTQKMMKIIELVIGVKTIIITTIIIITVPAPLPSSSSTGEMVNVTWTLIPNNYLYKCACTYTHLFSYIHVFLTKSSYHKSKITIYRFIFAQLRIFSQNVQKLNVWV